MDMEKDLFGDLPVAVEHRLFFGIFPSPRAAEYIEGEARRLGRLHNVHSVVPAARLHLSLNGVQRGPELPGELLQEAIDIGETIRRPAFDLVFDRIQTWDGGKRGGVRSSVPTVLCCSHPTREAVALYEDLRKHMQSLGLRVGARSFNPHITLWHAPARLPTRNLRQPLRLHIDRFCLVHTMAGARQAEHLAAWPLRF